MKRSKSKQSWLASSEDLPVSKRQKCDGAKDSNEPEELGTWLPKGDHWEDQVNKVETIERSDETGQLMVYVQFKNGKRSKMSTDMVYKHCPRPMLKFYEEHLNFK
jgi:chromobox protein 1